MTWDIKKVAMKDAVKSFLVTVDGHIDLEASTSRFRESALRHLASQEAETDRISRCMTQLFDTYRGATLNLEFIKSQTVQLMCKESPTLNDPSLFLTLSARVEEFLKENTNQPAQEAMAKRPAKPEITGKIYSMKFGKAGGWHRVSDQSPVN